LVRIALSKNNGKDKKMDKKIKFSEQPTNVKIIYGAVIAILCVTAIIIGIVSAASKKGDDPAETPPISGNENEGSNKDEGENGNENENKPPEKLTMVAPVVGEVTKYHSLEVPVFSNTLNEWRVHTGIDISAEEGTEVFATAAGTVTKVFSDPFLGKTVEISHGNGIVSIYSNLSATDVAVTEGQTVASGDKIGTIGDTSLSELADEPHLHFGIKLNDVSVNPLDYISDASKKASLGLTE
jgi:murein DD-endopeptidase MepM/ murein hydrolase activator NlpD